ncbi:unnamed protein product [Cuscuta europaea]|uniref:Uncharacterized protein n=1 Tax=Cuscuta europaea TaxID=41803 RepID=A0A9P0YYC3_CUSEU|nr:unnamed protein product [Cuscuta europaea]
MSGGKIVSPPNSRLMTGDKFGESKSSVGDEVSITAVQMARPPPEQVGVLAVRGRPQLEGIKNNGAWQVVACSFSLLFIILSSSVSLMLDSLSFVCYTAVVGRFFMPRSKKASKPELIFKSLARLATRSAQSWWSFICLIRGWGTFGLW